MVIISRKSKGNVLFSKLHFPFLLYFNVYKMVSISVYMSIYLNLFFFSLLSHLGFHYIVHYCCQVCHKYIRSYLLLYWKFAKCLIDKNRWSTERTEIEKNLNIWRYLVPHYNYKLDLKNNVSLSKPKRKL